MARIPLVEPSDGSPEVLRFYEKVAGWLQGQPGPRAAKAVTRVPQPWRALAHSPKLAETVYDGSSYILSKLPWAQDNQRQRQLLILAITRRLACEFAYIGHWPLSEKAGISRELFDQFATTDGLEEAKSSKQLSAEERLLITYADELARTGNAAPELFAQVLEHYGPRDTVEITGIIGYRIFTSVLINAFGLEDD